MKNIIRSLFLVFIFYLSSCEQSGSNQKSQSGQPIAALANSPNSDKSQISLNRIPMDEAQKMIHLFKSLRGKDIKPAIVSYWIPRNTLRHLYTLLKAERDSSPTNSKDSLLGKTDGVRIYFAYDLSSGIRHYTPRIIWVSTRDSGSFMNSQGQENSRLHHDYFEHNKQDSLFTDRDSSKQETGTNTPGALLFSKTFIDGDDSRQRPSRHALRVRRAYELVQKFIHKKDTINTDAVFYDMEALKYLADDSVHDGIRIYLANGSPKGDDKKNWDLIRDRFILVSTIRANEDINGKKTEFHLDNYYQNIIGAKRTSIFKPAVFISTAINTLSTAPVDMGEICPYNCN